MEDDEFLKGLILAAIASGKEPEDAINTALDTAKLMIEMIGAEEP